MVAPPTFDDVHAAARRIARHAHRTPVMTCRGIDRLADARVFFKCENLQKVGAFKFRGACNAVLSLDGEAAARGVATHSSGNHAAALALAASLRDIPAHVVMPEGVVDAKRRAVEGYGGRITLCEPTLRSRETTLADVLERTGANFIHPYDDPRVIAGQGTAALELLEEVPDLDVVMAPVGGGGLASGTAITVAALAPQIRVVGVEPRAADDARRSLAAGRILPSGDPITVADGLRTSLGKLTFEVIRQHVREIVTVEEADIVEAMRLMWERTKLLVEPSAAVPLAALLRGKVRAGRIGIIISGGNADLDSLPWLPAPPKPARLRT